MTIAREVFDRQPLFIRQGALELWGVVLATRSDLCRTRHLYSFSGFFVEACYAHGSKKLTCLCSFSQSARLAPYLDQIELILSR